MKTFSLMGVALLMLAGCSTTGDYQAYLSAQSDTNRQALEAQRPLVRITAQPGQSITGLANVTSTDMSNRSTTSSTVGDNSGSNSANSGRIAGADITDSTGTATVVTQPAPVVVTP